MQGLSYYHRDEQLSTAFITGGAGKIQNSYLYDAFGAESETNEQFPNRIRYTGQQYDDLIEQYYLRARYYNPVLYYDPSGFDSTLDPREYITPSNLIGLSATEKKNTQGIVTGLLQVLC